MQGSTVLASVFCHVRGSQPVPVHHKGSPSQTRLCVRPQAAAPAAKPAAAAPAPEQLMEKETRDAAYEIVSELWGLNGRAKPSPEGAVEFLTVRIKGHGVHGAGSDQGCICGEGQQRR